MAMKSSDSVVVGSCFHLPAMGSEQETKRVCSRQRTAFAEWPAITSVAASVAASKAISRAACSWYLVCRRISANFRGAGGE